MAAVLIPFAIAVFLKKVQIFLLLLLLLLLMITDLYITDTDRVAMYN